MEQPKTLPTIQETAAIYLGSAVRGSVATGTVLLRLEVESKQYLYQLIALAATRALIVMVTLTFAARRLGPPPHFTILGIMFGYALLEAVIVLLKIERVKKVMKDVLQSELKIQPGKTVS